jgi:hypothetical protein
LIHCDVEVVMTNRRDFLKSAAAAGGVLFAGCSMLANRMSAQQTGAASPKRRQAMVGGRRVRTIDMHAHVIVPEAMVMAGRKIELDNGNIITGKMAEERFAKMDALGYRYASPEPSAVLVRAGTRPG